MKGQGSIIVAVVFLSIIMVSVAPLVLHIYGTATNMASAPNAPVYRFLTLQAKMISREIVAFYNATDSTLLLVNRGGAGIKVERVVIYADCDGRGVYIDPGVKDLDMPSGLEITMQIPLPTQSVCGNLKTNTLYLITSEGLVISSTVITYEDIEMLSRQESQTTTIVRTTLPSAVMALPFKVGPGDNTSDLYSLLGGKGFEVCTLDSMENPTKVVSCASLEGGMKGGAGTGYVWSLRRVYVNTNINISNVIRNLWIGYDPRNVSRYNIVITADSATLATPSYSTSSPVRIKIYGFVPVTPQGILRLGGTWMSTPDQDIAKYTFVNATLVLNGTAERVEIYERTSGNETDYNPYIMFINTDRSRGFAGILFTTIDRAWGFYSSRNEHVDTLLDYSIKSLVLVYKDYSLSNIKYSSVTIAVNYRFHDNEGSDAQGTSVDKPIMLVGLVDASGVIYSYRSFTFRELTRYEDTYPPTAQAQSSMIFIPLPPAEQGERVYYVFIAIQDPYHYNGYLDDLDLTLYIESLVIVPVTR
ncbi:MAG: hypothetical protein QXY82_01990 [Desulfurococcaceae archaeon]